MHRHMLLEGTVAVVGAVLVQPRGAHCREVQLVGRGGRIACARMGRSAEIVQANPLAKGDIVREKGYAL